MKVGLGKWESFRTSAHALITRLDDSRSSLMSPVWDSESCNLNSNPRPPTKVERANFEKQLEEDKDTPIPLLHRMHDAKYTFANGGRRDYGGWNLVGMERQRSLTKRVKKRFSAKAKEIMTMQVNFLQKWRVECKRKIVCYWGWI